MWKPREKKKDLPAPNKYVSIVIQSLHDLIPPYSLEKCNICNNSSEHVVFGDSQWKISDQHGIENHKGMHREHRKALCMW